MGDKVDNIMILIKEIDEKTKKLTSMYRSLRRDIIKDKKDLEKFKNKQKKGKNNKNRSGIHQPYTVSEKLCSFMQKPKGTKIARTDATVYVNKYIKSKKLQNPENKKEIIPDNKLRDLFNIKEDINITYFQIPGCLNHHFTNKD